MTKPVIEGIVLLNDEWVVEEREAVLQPGTHLPGFITIAWERLAGGSFPRATMLLFACYLPHLMSDPSPPFKHLLFGALSGDLCGSPVWVITA